jgi:hypothetical protein
LEVKQSQDASVETAKDVEIKVKRAGGAFDLAKDIGLEAERADVVTPEPDRALELEVQPSEAVTFDFGQVLGLEVEAPGVTPANIGEALDLEAGISTVESMNVEAGDGVILVKNWELAC